MKATLLLSLQSAEVVVARATAHTTRACVLRTGGTCVVTADLTRSQANSIAGASRSTSTDSGTQLLNLSVLGIPIAANVAPNTVINLPGIGYLVLNEQFSDNGGLTAHACSGAAHSGHLTLCRCRRASDGAALSGHR